MTDSLSPDAWSLLRGIATRLVSQKQVAKDVHEAILEAGYVRLESGFLVPTRAGLHAVVERFPFNVPKLRPARRAILERIAASPEGVDLRDYRSRMPIQTPTICGLERDACILVWWAAEGMVANRLWLGAAGYAVVSQQSVRRADVARA